MNGTHIDINAASQILGLTPQQVRNLCRKKQLEAEKIGSSWILDVDDVYNYMTNNSCGIVEDRSSNYESSYIKKDNKEPISLSFFSGAMGLDLGIEMAGFKTLLACEVDKACRKTIIANRPNMALIGNILDYDSSSIREKAGIQPNDDIDLVVGGPPCQAFSTAGKRNGLNDSRGSLMLSYIDLILDLNPKYAVIENVRGILSAPLKHRPHYLRGDGEDPLSKEEIKGGALLQIVNRLRDGGYGVSFNLYNAANFGTPQKRERVIIIASRNGKKLPYLIPTHSETGEFGLPKWKTFGEAVNTLSYEHHHLNFPEKRIKFYKLLGPGENWRNLPEDLQKEALGKAFYSGGGKTGFFRRLKFDEPSPTLVTHPAMPATDLAHPLADRPLSIEEYKRLQEFPDEWKLSGSLIDQYRQIGNAVPVGLGKAVGTLLIKYLKKEYIEQYEGFKYSRYKNTDDISWEKQLKKEHLQLEVSINNL